MMISGRVNENREAVISLTLIGLVGEKHEIEAVIDTGFSGDLTLRANCTRLHGKGHV